MSNIQNVLQSNQTVLVKGSQLQAELSSEQVGIQLKAGDTLLGTVLSIIENEGGKTVNINVGENVLSAKLQDGMGLREGQTLNFAIKAFSSKNIIITPLFENTSADQSTIKALNAANIAINNDTITMVKEMMEAKLPINIESLQEMNKNLSNFPSTSISTMVEMKSLNIPITGNNVTQYESYKNYEHQVINEMQNILDELPHTFNSMVENGESSAALNLYGSVLKLFTQNNEQNVITSNDGMLVNEKNIQSQAQIQLHPQSESQVHPQERVDVANMPNGGSKILFNENNDNSARFFLSNEFMDNLRNVGLSDDTVNKVINTFKFGNSELAQKELLSEILKSFEASDLTNSIENTAWRKLFLSEDYNKLLKDNVSSQWLLKPEAVENKENIETFYQRLGNQIKHMAETVNNTAGAESKLGQATNNLQNNLDFMNQLNQVFQYVQLPLQMTGQNVHGDLYVYKNRREGCVQAFEVSTEHIEKPGSTNS